MQISVTARYSPRKSTPVNLADGHQLDREREVLASKRMVGIEGHSIVVHGDHGNRYSLTIRLLHLQP